MNRTIVTAFLSVLMLTPVAAKAEEKLVIYNWFEYMPQELLEKFTKETGISVTIDTYDSNESLLANLKGGALGTYDLAVASEYMVKTMIGEGVLDTYENGELKNKGNIKKSWADVPYDPDWAHSVPYQWGTTSFAVNTDVYKGDINTTAMLFDPPQELKGRINVLDSRREVMGFAALHLGISQCTEDRAEVQVLNDLLIKAKTNWMSFNSNTSKEMLVSGDAMAGMIWNGYAAKARQEGARVKYAWPKQGYLLWADALVLLANAPNRSNALKFMDFMLVPENAAYLTNWTRYSSSVEGTDELLDSDLRSSPENNPPSDVKGTFRTICKPETEKIYEAIWTSLRK